MKYASMKILMFTLCLMSGLAFSTVEAKQSKAKPEEKDFDCYFGKVETAIKKADHVLLLQFKEYIIVNKQLPSTIEKTTDAVYDVLYNWTKKELPRTITVRISKKQKVGEGWPMLPHERLQLKKDQLLIGFIDDVQEKNSLSFKLSTCIGGQALVKTRNIDEPGIAEINDYFIGAKHGSK